jgi:alkylation response protein AidB-like acyl-CoA dehydrogenase
VSLSLSAEQTSFRDTIRSFLQARSSERDVRTAMASREGFDPAVWSQLTGQLGAAGLSIPEEFGGAGYSFEETAIVLEECGRALLCAPLLSSVVASTTLLASGDRAAQSDLLPGIATGTTIATVALTNPPGRWDAQGDSVAAEMVGDEWRVSGRAPYVVDGHTASLLLVPARTTSGLGLFAVNGDGPGVARELLSTLDETRKLARIDLSGAAARPVGEPGSAEATMAQGLRMASVALANEQAGVTGAAVDMAVQYAKDRVQFGRPIGSFQAIKHKCADLHVALESSRSAARAAAVAAATAADDLPELAAIAAAFCGEACLLAGHENIQIHGGIGFTWEHPAHLYYKRAKSSEFLFGDVQYHREILAGIIGLERSPA